MILNFLKGCGFASLFIFVILVLLTISIVSAYYIQTFFGWEQITGFFLSGAIFIILGFGVLAATVEDF